MNARRITKILAGGASVAGISIVYAFPPAQYGFYPRCPFYAYTHFLCPGCGGTRALYEMLHGNLPGAWHYNALLTVLVPLSFVWSAVVWFRGVRSHRPPAFSVPRAAWIVVAAVAILFTVARNTGIAFVI
jgi:hypothetical protein